MCWLHTGSAVSYLVSQYSLDQEEEWADQVSINFRDLSKACPKDEFLVLHMELLIVVTTD